MPIDTAQLAALAAVIREGSFERAAATLHVTRSAVSQRIKLLEQRLGRVLLRRGTPCRPTEAGRAVFRHCQQLEISEADTLAALAGDAPGALTLAIGVNADSLATWFVPALAALHEQHGVCFDLHVEDQAHSAGLLRDGSVMAAVTAEPQPVQGCEVQRLGRMRYRAVASPAYAARHFSAGVDGATLARAPVLVFNRRDALQAEFMRRHTRRRLAPPVHWLPSPQGFVDAALAGLGWGMNPEALVQAHLQAGSLVDLAPRQPIDVERHWQCWRLDVAVVRALTDEVRRAATRALLA